MSLRFYYHFQGHEEILGGQAFGFSENPWSLQKLENEMGSI